MRLHPDNINRDNGIEIPEAWIPTIKKHNKRPVRQRETFLKWNISFVEVRLNRMKYSTLKTFY